MVRMAVYWPGWGSFSRAWIRRIRFGSWDDIVRSGRRHDESLPLVFQCGKPSPNGHPWRRSVDLGKERCSEFRLGV
jgi:hypothetical protein